MDEIIIGLGYYAYDKTNKIKTYEDYEKFINKIHKKRKYDNCIFYIDIEKVNKRIADFLIMSNGLPKNYNGVFYFNKNNFKCLDKNIDVNKKLFIENLINLGLDLIECKICFEKHKFVTTCSQCYFNICNKCLFKSSKDLNDCRCLICKKHIAMII